MKRSAGYMLKLFLAIVMMFAIVPQSVMQLFATDGLTNIAKDGNFQVKSTEPGRLLESLYDGNPSTLWCANNGEWPTTVRWSVPEENAKKIQKLVVKFEAGHPTWAVDIELNMYKDGEEVVIPLTSEQGHTFDKDFVYEFKDGENPSDILFTINNPKNGANVGTYSPAIAEFEVYTGDAEIEKEFVNLASSAIVTCASNDGETPASNLIDENYSSLYIFHKGVLSSVPGGEAWVQLDLKDDFDVNSFEIAFEKAVPDPINMKFTYSIYGMSKGSSDWQKLVASEKASRAADDNIKAHKVAVGYNTIKLSKIKIVIESIESTGAPWPAIAEFKINGVEKEFADEDNIAYKKPVHTNTNQASGAKLTDGNTTNNWSGAHYPGYADIDLEKNYNLDEIRVFLPTSGYTQYDIYTSMDGRDYSKLASKTDTNATPDEGDLFADLKTEARYVRVYMNYQSLGVNAIMNEIKIKGTESGTPLQTAEAINVSDYEDSQYNVEITPEMEIEEVKGIISRQLGDAYVNWFTFSLAENPKGTGYDFYQIENGENGKIHITGNDGVSLATGLNYYLKYYLNVHISQVGNQVKMPTGSVSITEPVFKETKMPIRYAYNYCTFSYSMAFWGEEEWRNELDWLALSGVNVVLDMTAQEEVWRRFLGEIGYSHQEAKDFISGPAYYAWAYMSNLSGFGGPVHDSWFEDRTELARKNQLAMRKLGMQPILQGYSGMVPVDVESKDPNTKGKVITQGTWNAFTRPSMLKTNTPIFNEYAEKFYRIQKDVFGDVSDYYATDPFHEGGNTAGMNMTEISKIVLDEMLKADDQSVWIIQSWQANPTPALLAGIADRKEHALILDLWADSDPRWDGDSRYGFSFTKEFNETPWVWCMLNNFGGRMGMRGCLDMLVNDLPKAIQETKYLQGIGITPEASQNNPVLYDLFFETIWSDDAEDVKAIDLDSWLKDYTTRRYGAESESAYQAMQIFKDTAYNSKNNTIGEGAPESVVNARPGLDISSVSCCGRTTIQYDKAKFEDAVALLLKDYDKLSDSAGYQYDLATVLEQLLANSAQEYQHMMTDAFREKDLEKFKSVSQKFLEIIDMVNNVTGTQESYLVGTWINQAKALGANADEFTKELYEFNARALITTWGSVYQANTGGLKDYSNRQWSGLTQDYYKARWERWINERIKDLDGTVGQNINANDWFQMEWDWVNSNNEYSDEPNGLSLKDLGTEIMSTYSIGSLPKDPNADDTNDCPVEGMSVTTGSQQSTTGAEGPAANLIDGSNDTIWHSAWAGTERENLWVDIKFDEETEVDGLRYLPRQDTGTNGNITSYRIDVKDSSGEYKTVATGTWANNKSWKKAVFEPVMATNVRLYAITSASDSTQKNYASGAELRITHPASLEDTTFAKEILGNAIAKVDAIDETEFGSLAPKVQEMITQAYDAAVIVMNNDKATSKECYDAWLKLANALHYADFTADKTELKSMIDVCSTLKEEDYASGFEAMSIALEEARNVYNDENALQARIDAAHSALLNAYNALVENKDTAKETLNDLVTMFDEIDSTKYCKNEAWTAFEKAMVDAKAVLANKDATAEQIHTALLALTSAYEDIRLLPDESVLAQLTSFIDKVDNLDLSVYSVENVARFKAAAGKARIMIDDVNAYDPAILDEIATINELIEKEQIVIPESPKPEVDNSTVPNETDTPKEPSETATPNVSVNGTTKPGTTKTGDVTNMMGMAVMMLVSAGAVAGLRKKQKRNKS